MAVEKKMRDWEATALGGLADAFASGAASEAGEEVQRLCVETLMIYNLSPRKFATQNDLD